MKDVVAGVEEQDGGDGSTPQSCPSPAQDEEQESSHAPLLHLWQASGITEQMLDRPMERKIMHDALARLSQQAGIPSLTAMQDSFHSSSPPRGDSWHRHRTSFSSHPSYHTGTVMETNNHPSPSIPSPSQAIFVSSAKAGLGADGLLQSLLSSSPEEQPSSHKRNKKNFLLIDCDRANHPDPHVPIIRALSAWVIEWNSALRRDMTTPASEDTTFLNNFVHCFSDALEVKERSFLQTHIPLLHQLLTQYDSGNIRTGTTNDSGTRWSTTISPKRVPVKNQYHRYTPSSFSSRYAENLYSGQKLATVFRPTFAKFVYSLTEAMTWCTERGTTNNDSTSPVDHSAPPTIIVFQNLHRGDEVLLETLRYLLRAQDLRPLERPYLAVVTYQQDPVNYMPPLIEIAFEDLNRPQVQKTKINLELLDRSVLERRLEDLLQEDDGETLRSLLGDGSDSWLVAKKLEACVLNGSLALDSRTSTWTFADEVPYLNPVELCGLDQISPLEFQFLQIFSCLGMKTSKSILMHSQASDNLDLQLTWAVEQGFLVSNENENEEYAFQSEELRDLIYHDIPEDERPKFHYQIAENLWISLDIVDLDKHLVVVVENLLSGSVCLPNQRRRIAVAQLCLRAGEQRAEVSAYRSAHFYFMSGIELLRDSWSEAYELCLALHSSACEVAFCLALWEDIMRLARVVLAHARTLQDEVRAHISKIYAIGTQGDSPGSIEYGSSLLRKLGEPILQNPSRWQAMQSIVRTNHRLRGLTDEAIMRLPAMESTEKISAMRVLNALLPYAYNAGYLLFPFLLIDKMIELTLKHGTSALSGVAFAMFASGKCWQGDIESGQRYGAVALRLSEKYRVDSWIGRVVTLCYSSVMTWHNPFRDSVIPMRAARQISLACGDIEFAMINANLSCLLELDLVPIPDLLNTIREYHVIMRKFGQTTYLSMLSPSLLILLSCSGEDLEDFTVMQDAKQKIGPFQENVDDSTIVRQWCQYARMFVAYLFDDIDGAAKCARLCASLINSPMGSADVAMPCLVEGLITVERCRRQKWMLPYCIPRLRRRIRQLHHFATGSPSNFLGKLHLLKAEMASVLGQHNKAFLYYTSAIVLLRDAGFYIQLGLANEAAAKHFIRRNEVDRAERYMVDAEKVYRSWGGHAKADHFAMQMKSYYPE